MDRTGSRLTLWRNTIQLFYDYVSISYKGPLKCAGYQILRVEPKFLDKESERTKPDITAIDGHNHWLCLELTLKSGPKDEQLQRYLTIDPRYLTNYGVTSVRSKPDVICSRLDSIDNTNYCQMTVGGEFDAVNIDTLNHKLLADCLTQAKGVDLRKLPTIAISLLPESKGAEVNQGIYDIVMKLFEGTSRGLSAQEIVDISLERIADKVDVEDKIQLTKKIAEVMDGLVNKELRDYLERTEDGIYRALPDVNIAHYSTRQKIARILGSWAFPSVPLKIEEYNEESRSSRQSS